MLYRYKVSFDRDTGEPKLGRYIFGLFLHNYEKPSGLHNSVHGYSWDKIARRYRQYAGKMAVGKTEEEAVFEIMVWEELSIAVDKFKKHSDKKKKNATAEEILSKVVKQMMKKKKGWNLSWTEQNDEAKLSEAIRNSHPYKAHKKWYN